jgi:hypothetical protein
MKKAVFLFLLVFNGIVFSQNQTYFKFHLGKEYNGKQIQIRAIEKDIYFFKNNNFVSKTPIGQKSRVVVLGSENYLYSESYLGVENIVFENQTDISSSLLHRNTLIAKKASVLSYLSIWILAIIVLIVGIKVSNIDIFYGLLLPWVAYSNTEELMSKINFNRLILPVFLFVFSLIASIWVFNPAFGWLDLFFSIALVLFIFVIKIILLYVLEFLLEIRNVARKHIIEYLKMGIFLFLLLFSLKTIEILNNWNFSIVYKYLVFFYLLIWLVRLLLILYKESQKKIIYFFSYLCVSEVLPIMLVAAFWKS